MNTTIHCSLQMVRIELSIHTFLTLSVILGRSTPTIVGMSYILPLSFMTPRL